MTFSGPVINQSACGIYLSHIINSLISDWELCRAGIPQGTKFGPILFAIMINDLAVKSPLILTLTADHWKFVDDVTLSEVVKSESTAILQTDLDTISAWSKDNNMNLNPKKYKEMVVCLLKHTPGLAPLLLNEVPVE